MISIYMNEDTNLFRGNTTYLKMTRKRHYKKVRTNNTKSIYQKKVSPPGFCFGKNLSPGKDSDQPGALKKLGNYRALVPSFAFSFHFCYQLEENVGRGRYMHVRLLLGDCPKDNIFAVRIVCSCVRECVFLSSHLPACVLVVDVDQT